MSNQPTEYEQVTYNSPDGAQVGKGTTEKVGFYGSTPVSQPTNANQAAVTTTAITTASTTSSPAGYATTTQADNIATIVNATRTLANQIRSDLVTLGILKGS